LRCWLSPLDAYHCGRHACEDKCACDAEPVRDAFNAAGAAGRVFKVEVFARNLVEEATTGGFFSGALFGGLEDGTPR
jgi:hypothetical protein